MDPSFSGSRVATDLIDIQNADAVFVLDPSKYTTLTLKEKRELVFQLSKSARGFETLQSWSRKDLLEILCAEMGKERKYTGVVKTKLIEHLLQIIHAKTIHMENTGTFMDHMDSTSHEPPSNHQTSAKRQRKADNPSRLPVGLNYLVLNNGSDVPSNPIYCQNLACRATLAPDDNFCRRCTCCICYIYDDNKDPGLWLVCSSDPPSEGNWCGVSCHLECALRHEKAGIAKSMLVDKLDGSFYCVSCGKINDLLRCWKKQLLVAKDARRVDVLCHRISLSYKLLEGTKKYENLHQIVDGIKKKLEAELGPLNALPTGMARGIVNRLSSGVEAQKLCVLAVELFDSMICVDSHSRHEPKFPKASLVSSTLIRFENICPTSLTVTLGSEDDQPIQEVVGYNLWHRRKDAAGYPAEPTCRLIKPERKFTVSKLIPGRDYIFKVVAFDNEKDLGLWEVVATTSAIQNDVSVSQILTVEDDSVMINCGSPKTNSSGLSNPSEGDESNNTAACRDLNKLPEDYLGHFDKPEIPGRDVSEGKEASHSHATLEGTPGNSISALDEEPNSTNDTAFHRDNPEHQSGIHELKNRLKSSMGSETNTVPQRQVESVLPVTPSKLEACKESTGRNGRIKPTSTGTKDCLAKPVKDQISGSSSKKNLALGEGMFVSSSLLDGDYEYCVKVIRWLECNGHIETNFRVKFLTWFSLRASPPERKVVSVFVDTLIDDPPSLAGQLVDTFAEGINGKSPPAMPTGFCTKLWH